MREEEPPSMSGRGATSSCSYPCSLQRAGLDDFGRFLSNPKRSAVLGESQQQGAPRKEGVKCAFRGKDCVGKVRERKVERKLMGKGKSTLSGKEGHGLFYCEFGVSHFSVSSLRR